MGEVNTVPMKINSVEGAAGQVKISGGPGVVEAWGAPVPAVHGVAQHTDVTRTKFFSCGILYTGGLATWRCVVLLNKDNDEHASFSFGVPSNFVAFISLEVVWYGVVGGVAGQDWRVHPRAWYNTENEAPNIHTNFPANSDIDVAVVDQCYFTDVGLTLASLALGDVVGVEIEREGTHVNDTYDQDIGIMGLLLTYTASQ